MKKIIILAVISFVSCFSLAQTSGLFGKKNLFNFQLIQSPAYAARQPVKMTSDTESKMYLAPFIAF